MRTHSTTAVLTLVLMTGLVLGTAGCDENNGNTNTNDNTNDNTNQNNTPIPAMDAVDQTVTDASTVAVASALSVGPGWVVIHVDEMGTPGEVLGHSAVMDGASSGVSVSLSRAVANGELLWAMLHQDLGVVGTWEPMDDVAAVDGDGAVVSDSFVVTVVDPGTQSISAVDQTLSDLSTVVSVADVVSTGPGWVVIHVDDMGTPGTVVGMAAVSAGFTLGVDVILGGPAADGDGFIAMLHEDLGVVGTWEPAEDVPATNDMDPVVSTFTVTVPAATPAVRITVTSVGMSAYDFTAAEPATFADDLIGAEADNQSLTLLAGWRYEVVNQASGGHPFELLTVGANPSQDTLLLSQSAAGTLEDDADINWTDDASQTVQFTVAPTLAAALDGYRCAIHTTTMRSSVSITP